MYEENPSITGAFPVTLRSKSQKNGQQALMIAPDTGQVLGEGKFGFITEEEVDNEQFVKIYFAGIKQHGQLTKAGLTLFEYVYHQMSGKAGKDNDTIGLGLFAVQRWKPDMSRATYFRGLNELLDKGFLFRTLSADLFFINVRFMFNGDRLQIVKSYRRKKTDSHRQPELPLSPRMIEHEGAE